MKAVLVTMLLMLAVSGALASNPEAPQAPDAGYAIPWWSVDGGGGTSQGGTYVLSGTAGQVDAGTASGGPYVLTGGFFGGAVPYKTFMPLMRR
jgi:hypothetical protein